MIQFIVAFIGIVFQDGIQVVLQGFRNGFRNKLRERKRKEEKEIRSETRYVCQSSSHELLKHITPSFEKLSSGYPVIQAYKTAVLL